MDALRTLEQPETPAPAGLDPRARAWRYRVFAATWLSYAGYYFCRKPFFIAKASLADELAWDPMLLGYLGTGYLVAYTIGQFVAGAAGNRFGPRALVLAGMGLSIACNVVFGITNSWATFGLFLVLNGFAQATGWSGNVGTMASWFHRGERGTVMGLWATNFQVGGVLAGALAAAMLGWLGFQWSFFAGSAVLMAVWTFYVFNQRDKPEDVGLAPIEHEDDDPDGGGDDGGWTRQIMINVAIVGVFYFFVKFIRYALWSWAPFLLNRSYGLEVDQAGYLSTVFDLAGIAGVIVIGLLSDRLFGGRRAFVSFLFILGMAASCVLLYTLGPASLVLFGVSMGLIGFTLYGPDALMSGAGAIDVGSRRTAVLAAGVINGMGSCGSVVQELLLGRLLDGGGAAPVFATLLGSSVCAAACLGVLLLRNRLGHADM